MTGASPGRDRPALPTAQPPKQSRQSPTEAAAAAIAHKFVPK